jgi:predicted RNase H-like HicB family nuclease
MKKILQVNIEKGEKYYIAHFIDLPIVTQGKTLDKLVKNIQEAFELYVEEEALEKQEITEHPSILANLELSYA